MHGQIAELVLFDERTNPVVRAAIANDENLIVATQGRSLWILDDLSVLHQLDAGKKSMSSILYKPKDSYRTGGRSSSEPSKTEGANHPNGVISHFYLKNLGDDDKVAITYTTMAGDTLASFNNTAKEKDKKLKVEKGGNTHVWNTRGEKAETLKGMIFWAAGFNGPKAVPGSYKVHLNVNGDSQSQDFNIIPDPRAEVTVADMQKQHDFISAINATINKAHGSIKKIRGVNKQLDAFTEQYKDNEATKDLVEKAKTMKESFGEIEKALYQTQNQSNQDPLNFPIRLTNKLAHLNRLVGMGDFPPTAQDEAVQKEMTGKIETQLKAFDAMVDSEMQEFNKAFNDLKLNYLFVEEE